MSARVNFNSSIFQCLLGFFFLSLHFMANVNLSSQRFCFRYSSTKIYGSSIFNYYCYPVIKSIKLFWNSLVDDVVCLPYKEYARHYKYDRFLALKILIKDESFENFDLRRKTLDQNFQSQKSTIIYYCFYYVCISNMIITYVSTFW